MSTLKALASRSKVARLDCQNAHAVFSVDSKYDERWLFFGGSSALNAEVGPSMNSAPVIFCKGAL